MSVALHHTSRLETTRVIDLRSAPSLRIRAFGTLRIDSPLGRFGVRDLGGIKPKQVLELLVLARRSSVSKVQLAELLWGSQPPKNASGTLENYVSVLRRRLLGSGPDGRHAIRTEHEAYCLAPGHVACDLDVFDELVAQRSPSMSAEEELHLLDQAVALADGLVFEDEPYAEWVLAERDRYRQRALVANLEAGELALRLGRTQRAQDYADASMRFDAYDERGVRLQMRACVAMGSTRSARAVYDRCRRTLAEELGIEPDPATTALAASIDRDDTTPEAARAVTNYFGPERRQASPLFAPSGAVNGASAELIADGPVDNAALQALTSACALAHARGGTAAILRLLREATTLQHDLVAIDAVADDLASGHEDDHAALVQLQRLVGGVDALRVSNAS
jgi:DNA-binding SARP family transcriptional activator